jgi:superfamily II DNA or RNA helicase
MEIFQSNIEFIEARNKQEAKFIRDVLTFNLKKFKKEEVLRAFKEVEPNLFQVPRYAHTFFETTEKRLDIERDDFVEKPVKYPKFLPVLRPEQKKAVDAYLRHQDDNVLVLPPASGKTLLALYIAQKLGQKAIILLHRGAFFKVWKDDIVKAFNMNPNDVGEIRGNKFKIGRQLTLASFQTLHSRDYDIYDEFGLVIGDECLVGGTRIEMADGSFKPIRDIKNGDKVVGGTVRNKFAKLVDQLAKVYVGHRTITGSLRHPLLVVTIQQHANGLYHSYKLERKMMKDLKEGDLLAVRVGKKFMKGKNRKVMYSGQHPYRLLPVKKVEIINKPTIVYDFTTDTHTFNANGILSSNCHHVPAATFSGVVSKFNAKHMLGITGTYERTDGLHVLTNLYMGRIAYYNDEADLDHVEIANIYRVNTNVPISVRKGEHISSFYHSLLSNRDRFLLFLELFTECYKRGRKQLIFMHSKTYAKLYTALLNSLGYKVMLSMGRSISDKTNEIAKQMMLEGKIDAIVATVQFLKEGESINNIDTIHQLTPITNLIDWRQSIARGQRQHPDKKEVVVLDYVDNLVPRALRYYQERVLWSQKNNTHRYRTKPIDQNFLSVL